MNTRSVQRALNSFMGQGSHPSAGEGMNGEHQEPAMRIGPEFQACIQEMRQPGDPLSEGPGSVMIWAPSNDIRDEDVDAFLMLAKDQFGYGNEQALGLLYWHKYNIEKAVEDLPNFCPLQDEWTMEDKVTFEQAFQYHGKNFQRIRAMLPDKPISSLVKYYYLWKRSYSHYSLMDKHSRKNSKRISAGLPVSNDDADSTKSGSSRSDNHFLPPSLPVMFTGKGKQLPKGIHLSTPELATLSSDTEHTQQRLLDKEMLELKEKIQWYKQELGFVKDSIDLDDLEQLRPANFTRRPGVPTRWTDEEIQIALEVIQKYGKDYEVLSGALEGKTVSQCRNFFTNYKRKLNLPRLIAEFEIRNGQKHSRYSKQAREMLESETQDVMEGDQGMGEIVYIDGGPQAKRVRLSNSMPDMAAEVSL